MKDTVNKLKAMVKSGKSITLEEWIDLEVGLNEAHENAQGELAVLLDEGREAIGQIAVADPPEGEEAKLIPANSGKVNAKYRT